MTKIEAAKSPIDWLIKEPVSYFCVIALTILGANVIFNSTSEELLEIDQKEIDALVFLREISLGNPLSQAQISDITQTYIEEQLLVQEALNLGLDKDTRIHTILAQKARHVLSADVIQPTPVELDAFFTANIDRYRSRERITVEELVFDSRQELSAETMLGLQAGLSAAQLIELEAGNSAPLARVSQQDIGNIFSAEFAQQVFASELNQWAGPYLSNRGQHWLQITEKFPAAVPELAEVVDLLRLDWIAAEEDKRLDAKIANLKTQYTIVLVNENN